MRKFTAIWASSLVTMTGTALTGFALGVWVYLETGSTTQLALTFVLAFLPGILFSPLAGALVDRWDRRVILLVSDAVGIGTTLTLGLLYMAGHLEPWHIFTTTLIRSSLRAMQVPALNSIVVLLAPREQIGRANGLMGVANAVSQTVAPALGGALMVGVGLDGVLFIDCATFLVNVVVLFVTRIPAPQASKAGAAGKGSLRAEIGQGWRALAGKRALVALALFYAALDLSVGFVDILITPMVISFASVSALGLVLTIGGIGLVLGSVTMASWGGPRRRVHGTAGFAVPLGLFLCLGSLRPSVALVATAAFGFMFCSMIIDGTSRSIIGTEVEPDLQGRAFATFNMVTNTVLCSSYLLAGPVADRVFEPLLAEKGPLAGSVGEVLGTGPGRGMALLLGLLGLLVLATAVAGYLTPALRGLSDRAPKPAAEDSGEEPAHDLAGDASGGTDAGTDTDRESAEPAPQPVSDR
ncbi:MFS transporter [Streptomyces sp. MUM 136J]|nr:MFS transporter [Streptomyces sp. MUM 136J]MCH0563659.1 MFS transporter [Streptomyces sp. MUM 2J]MCH0570793.1 MFS transporter [Streptomyces sp. MUM 136J]